MLSRPVGGEIRANAEATMAGFPTTHSFVLAASVALLACGGTTASPSSPSADSGTPRDSSSPDGSEDARAPEDGGSETGPDLDAGHDAGPSFDATSDTGPAFDGGGGCTSPVIQDGGEYLGCSRAMCPAGTICVQRDYEVASTAMCVAIPSQCVSAPTCACMGTVAQECAEPGVTDASPGFLPCQDEEEGDVSFLDFPCGCA